MDSKYNEYWASRWSDLEDAFATAARSGYAEVDTRGIRSWGNRQSWHGAAEVDGRQVIYTDGMVPTRSLGELVAARGLLDPYPGGFRLAMSRDGALRISRAGAPADAAGDDGSISWSLRPGEEMTRERRAELFGGSVYGGIQPSNSTPNIFLYSDPSAGLEHGYNFDGWDARGSVFLYTGEGQRGEQRLRAGNRALANHAETGRDVHLFVADGYVAGSQTRVQRYVGQFRVDSDNPWVRAEAPDQDGLVRTVLVFRLLPVGDALRRDQDRSEQGDQASTVIREAESLDLVPMEALAASVPAEGYRTESFERQASSALTAFRRESELAERFKSYLEGIGREVCRYRLRPPGLLQDLYTDLYDQTKGILFEIKATASRESVRMALGQLLDYQRFMPTGTQLAVLLPGRPTDELIELLDRHRVACVVPDGDRFTQAKVAG